MHLRQLVHLGKHKILSPAKRKTIDNVNSFPQNARYELIAVVGRNILATFFHQLGLVRAKEELALEQLNGNDGKNELKQKVDDEDVEHILQ